MQLPLFSLHARLMCSTVLSEFTLRMFAIDFFLWSITDCLSINNESRWRTTEAAWKIWKWWVGEWAYFIFFPTRERHRNLIGQRWRMWNRVQPWREGKMDGRGKQFVSSRADAKLVLIISQEIHFWTGKKHQAISSSNPPVVLTAGGAEMLNCTLPQ